MHYWPLEGAQYLLAVVTASIGGWLCSGTLEPHRSPFLAVLFTDIPKCLEQPPAVYGPSINTEGLLDNQMSQDHEAVK